jgi:hypothetical protein
MEYIILIIGIALIVYGMVGEFREKDDTAQLAQPIMTAGTSGSNKDNNEDKSFDSIFAQNIILDRLDDIENKIDYIYDKYKDVENTDTLLDDQQEIKKIDEEDTINKIIFKLKDGGADVEDIAQKTGMLKGEVLLRLGMRKQ